MFFVYLIPGRICRNLEMLVFEERGKPKYPEKNLSEQGKEPTTNSTHILWRRRRDLNPGHIGRRRALSPLRHPLLPKEEVINLIQEGVFHLIPILGEPVAVSRVGRKGATKFSCMGERAPGYRLSPN